MKKRISQEAVPTGNIENRIFVIRGHRVILDSDLAEAYGVLTKRLNEQVRRNRERFPDDFMFQLTPKELENLRSSFPAFSEEAREMRSQIATASKRNIRYLPYAFTEHGALMAANVLNSPRAVTMSIYVIRAFVRLREVFVLNQVLQERLAEIEKILLDHDTALRDLYKRLKPLLLRPKRTDAVGFQLVSPRPGKIG
jgi:hypothetical protein